MDEFLVSIGLGLRQMAGLPDPNELLADAPYMTTGERKKLDVTEAEPVEERREKGSCHAIQGMEKMCRIQVMRRA